MLNQYEGSAIAESDEGIDVPVASFAAEQQNSTPSQISPEMSPLQMLHSIVAHNVENPENRLTLPPEQGKAIMKDFVDFVAGSNAPSMTEDGRIKTFSEMDDNEILKHLPEYLGSGNTGTSINGSGIEAAQELIAEQYMTEDELEDHPDPKTPKGKEIREKKLLDKAREAQGELAAIQAKWDNDMHSIGGHEYSGADLHKVNNYLLDPQNTEGIEQQLMDSLGISREEAKKRRANIQDLAKLLEKERNGEKLTPEELKKRQELEAGQAGQDYHVMADKVLGIEGQKYGATVSAEKTGQIVSAAKESTSGRSDALMEADNGDSKIQGIALVQQKVEASAAKGYTTKPFDVKMTALDSKPVANDLDDLMSPVIKASALRPVFARADASQVPLESSVVVAVTVNAPKQSPQMGGLDV